MCSTQLAKNSQLEQLERRQAASDCNVIASAIFLVFVLIMMNK